MDLERKLRLPRECLVQSGHELVFVLCVIDPFPKMLAGRYESQGRKTILRYGRVEQVLHSIHTSAVFWRRNAISDLLLIPPLKDDANRLCGCLETRREIVDEAKDDHATILHVRRRGS